MALALVEEPGAVNVMHGFHSKDLDNWEHLGIIAWGVASLGLAIDADQSLLITAIQEVRPPTWWELRGDPPIRGYKYDGTTWHPKAWKIEDKDTKAWLEPRSCRWAHIALAWRGGGSMERILVKVIRIFNRFIYLLN